MNEKTDPQAASVNPVVMRRLVSMLIDLGRFLACGTHRSTPFSEAMHKRIRDPALGDLVVETSNFKYDIEGIGVYKARVKQPSGEWHWEIEQLIDGQIRTWGNCEFVSLPTKELRKEVMDAIKLDA